MHLSPSFTFDAAHALLAVLDEESSYQQGKERSYHNV